MFEYYIVIIKFVCGIFLQTELWTSYQCVWVVVCGKNRTQVTT